MAITRGYHRRVRSLPTQIRSFKLFKDEELFPELHSKDPQVAKHLQPINEQDKLHSEQDYDTDDEQIRAAKELLLQDFKDTINFFVNEQPLLLVRNIAKYC
jgi:hypothetical protein